MCRAMLPRPRSGVVLLLLALLFAGCVRGNVYDFLAYDAPTDTFTFLQLDLNIAGEQTADREYLVKRWQQRDEIITYPAFLRFFGLPALLRIDANNYQEIDLAQSAAKEQPQVECPFRLDTIAIQPGSFFLSANNTLCYYQRVAVSGKVLDEILALLSQAMCKDLAANGFPNERKRRREGGKPGSWEKLRQEIGEDADAVNQPDGTAAPPAKAAPQQKADPDQQSGWFVDDASLDLLAKAAAAGQLAIERKGAEFAVSLPMSAEDCRQAKLTLDFLWSKVVEHAKATAKPGEDRVSLPDLQTEIAGDNHFVIKVTVKQFIGLSDTNYPDAKPDPKLAANYRDTIAALEEQKIPIDRKLTVQQVISDFAGRPK